MSTDFAKLAYVEASSYRGEVLEHLSEGIATPKRITEANRGDIAHYSRALRQLEEKGVVELLVDDDVRKGRFYGLTDEGEELAERYEEMVA